MLVACLFASKLKKANKICFVDISNYQS